MHLIFNTWYFESSSTFFGLIGMCPNPTFAQNPEVFPAMIEIKFKFDF